MEARAEMAEIGPASPVVTELRKRVTRVEAVSSVTYS